MLRHQTFRLAESAFGFCGLWFRVACSLGCRSPIQSGCGVDDLWLVMVEGWCGQLFRCLLLCPIVGFKRVLFSGIFSIRSRVLTLNQTSPISVISHHTHLLQALVRSFRILQSLHRCPGGSDPACCKKRGSCFLESFLRGVERPSLNYRVQWGRTRNPLTLHPQLAPLRKCTAVRGF